MNVTVSKQFAARAMKIAAGPLSFALYCKLASDVFTPTLFDAPGGFFLGSIAGMVLFIGVKTTLTALSRQAK